MTQDTLLPFDLPAVKRKKVTADFGGGLISSDGGLVLLRGAERRLGLAEALAGCIRAGCIRDWRDPSLVVHTLPAMLRFRMFAITCGCEDDNWDVLCIGSLFTCSSMVAGMAPNCGAVFAQRGSREACASSANGRHDSGARKRLPTPRRARASASPRSKGSVRWTGRCGLRARRPLSRLIGKRIVVPGRAGCREGTG